MAKLKDEICCAKCNVEMKLGMLPSYAYEEGHMLHNVHAYQCPACNKVFFTEDQAKEMKSRTKDLKEYAFGFQRKITISGKSLVVGIPSELAEHLKIKKGQTVRVIPVAHEGFMIKT